MKQKVRVLLLVVCMLLATCCIFVACNNGNDSNSDDVTVTLSQQTLSLDLYEPATLEATVTGSTADPTWSSSDSATVSVDQNGNIVGLKEGSATITASVGGQSAQCTVTVEETGARPQFVGLSTSLELGINDEQTLAPTVEYKGKTLSGLTISYATEDTDYITVSNDGTITAVKVTAQNDPAVVTVSTAYYDWTVSATVNVTVMDDVTISLDVTNLALYISAPTEDFATTHQLVATITDNGNSITSLDSVEFVSSDSESVTVSDTGLVSAVALTDSPVTITVTYTSVAGQDFTATCTVTVSRPVIEETASIDMLGDEPYVFESTALAGATVDSVQYENTDITFTTGTNTVSIALSEFSKIKTGEDKRISIVLDNGTQIDIVATVYATITTADQFTGMRDYLTVDNVTLTGIIYLGDDIDFEDATINGIGAHTGTTNNYEFTDLWAGTFDGKGYTISNFTISEDFGSLFAYITPDGVVTNLAIVDATISGAKGGIVSTINEGEISNIFIKGEIVNGDGCLNGSTWDYINQAYSGVGMGSTALVTSVVASTLDSPTATIHDVFAVVDNWSYSNDGQGGIIVSCVVPGTYGRGEYNLYNLYAVNGRGTSGTTWDADWGNKLSAVANNNANRGTNHQPNADKEAQGALTESDLIAQYNPASPMASKNIKTFIGGYSDFSNWLADEDNEFVGFDGDVWTKVGKIPVFKTSADVFGSEADFAVTQTTVAVGVTDTQLTIAGTTKFTTVSFALKTPIDGVSLTSDGKLTVASSVVDGTEITVVVTSPVYPDGVETVITVENAVQTDLTDTVIADLLSDGSVTIELEGLTGVTDVKYGDTSLDYTTGTNSVIIEESEFAAVKTGEKLISIYTSGTRYDVLITVVANIDSPTEFTSMKDYLNVEGDTLTGIINLSDDIDFDGATINGIGEVTGTGYNSQDSSSGYVFTDKWAGTFDGKGYTISNFTINSDFGSLFAWITSEGSVTNLALVDVTLSNAAGGVVSTINEGEISNIFVKGTITGGKDAVINSTYNGAGSGTASLVTSTLSANATMHDIFAVLESGTIAGAYGGIIIGFVNISGWSQSGRCDYVNVSNLYAVNGNGNSSWGTHLSAVGSSVGGHSTNHQGSIDNPSNASIQWQFVTDSDKIAQYVGEEHPMVSKNIKTFLNSYTELSTWVADEENEFAGFTSDVWTKLGKIPVFKTCSDVFGAATDLAVTQTTVNADGTQVQLTLAGTSTFAVTYSLKEAVEGVEITSDGKLTVADTVANDTPITVVVTSIIYPNGVESTITVRKVTTESVSLDPIDLSTVTDNITLNLGSGIAGANSIDSVTYNDADITFSEADGVITIAKSEFEEKVGSGEIVLTASADDAYYYTVNVTVADKIITTPEEFTGMKTYLTASGEDALTGYILLGDNIDLEDATYNGIGEVSGSDGNYTFTDKWAGTFNGNGHTVSNFTINSNFGSLFAWITSSGVVKNLALVDVTLSNAAGGVVSTINEGEISNIFVKGTISSGKDAAIGGSYGTGTGAPSLVTSTLSASATMHDIFVVSEGSTITTYGGLIIGFVNISGWSQSGRCDYVNVSNLYAVNVNGGTGWGAFVSAVGSSVGGSSTNHQGSIDNPDNASIQWQFVTDSDMISQYVAEDHPMVSKNVKTFKAGYSELTTWVAENEIVGFTSDVWTKVSEVPVFKTCTDAIVIG